MAYKSGEEKTKLSDYKLKFKIALLINEVWKSRIHVLIEYTL